MSLVLNSWILKLLVLFRTNENCNHLKKYTTVVKAFPQGVQNMTRGMQNLTGGAKYDSSPCHILHPHTLFDGCKIWCYTGNGSRNQWFARPTLEKTVINECIIADNEVFKQEGKLVLLVNEIQISCWKYYKTQNNPPFNTISLYEHF